MASCDSDADLLAEYIAAFENLDDLYAFDVSPALLARTDEYGLEHWQPRQITTLPSVLKALYQGLGLPGFGSTRFPPLYEILLLTHRWAKVDLGNYRLLANEPAKDFAPLLAAMRDDACLFANLVPNGYIQFGQGPELGYDPVCFDFRQRQENGDCRIVKIDHEAILCKGRIRETAKLAPDFRSLVFDTIHEATALHGSKRVSHRAEDSDC